MSENQVPGGHGSYRDTDLTPVRRGGSAPTAASAFLSSTADSDVETAFMRSDDGQDVEGGNETINVADLIIRRIAKNLGVPVSSLNEEPTIEPCQGMANPGLIELRTLLNAFLRLEHPAARRRCIATAEAELGRQLKLETERH